MKKTNLKKYGVEYPIQNIEIFKKLYKKKQYTFKNGVNIRVQGYEPFALKLLENNGYNYDDLDFNFSIKYNYNNKHKIYFPDIYIPKENRIIEVKSKYTYEKMKKLNLAKCESCIKKGFNFEFWIFNKKGELIKK